MSVRARSKYVMDGRPTVRSGLTLYCAPHSIPSLWVRLVLAEKDVDSARVEWVSPSRPNQDLLVLNPSLELPTLADRDLVLHAAAVIAEYLDERYPHPKLMPPDPAARARLRMALLEFQQHLFPLAEQARERGDDGKTARKALGEALQRYQRLFPARGWFLGLEYNLADCAWAALLSQLPQLGLKSAEDIPWLAPYAGRLLARPSVRTALPSAE